MDDHVLFLTKPRESDTDRVVRAIDAVHEASNAVPLPLFALAGLLVRKLAAHENAVARLEVLQLDRRGILQIFLSGRDSKEFGSVLNQNGHVNTRIIRQRNGIP